MKNTYQVIPRNLIIIFNNECVLLQKGNPDKIHWANMYNGLGGHIEANENVYSSATRELLEESGIKLKNRQIQLKGIIHVHTYFNEKAFMFIFSAEVKSQRFIDSNEGKLEWVQINKLKLINNIAEDIKTIVLQIKKLHKGQIISGTSKYNKERKLIKFSYDIVSV
jgi:8-oxo-dGTP diphosphatase